MADRTVEDLLALINGDDDDDDAASQKKAPNPVADLRNQLKQVLKEKKEADRINKQLAEELATYRQEREAAVWQGMQVDEKHQALYKKLNPDSPVTAEGVQSFLEEYGLVAPAAESSDGAEGGETPPAGTTEPPAPEFKPTLTQGQLPSNSKRYTPQEFDQLRRENPGLADRVLREGRIDHVQEWPGGPR